MAEGNGRDGGATVTPIRGDDGPGSPSRRTREKARRAELVEKREERLKLENAILAAIAGGASTAQIAKSRGIPKRQIELLYDAALDRIERTNVEDFRRVQHHRLTLLMQSRWVLALNGDPGAYRDVLAAIRELNLLEGAYAPVRVGIEGEVTVRAVGLRDGMRALAEIQAGLIERGEAPPPPSLGLGSYPQTISTNGHGPSAA